MLVKPSKMLVTLVMLGT
nr:unnamed protein product [Callosobruchus analis]